MVIGIYIFAFALVLVAVIYRFTFGLRKRPGQTSQTQLVMLTLIGSGMLLMSTTSLTEIALSKIISSNGIVTRHRVTTGKNSHTSFVLLKEDGDSVWLTCSYTGSALFNGAHVHTEYRDRTGDITKIQVLHGSQITWSETESGGLGQPSLLLILGTFLLWLAYKIYRKRSTSDSV